MKQNFSFIYKLLLVVGDALALLLAFSLAYILRVTLDPRPITQPVEARTYLMLIFTLLPVWLCVFAVLGLYAKRNYERRPREAMRLLIGSVAGVLLLVSFDFFSTEVIFPAKLVPIYAAGISFLLLWAMRTILRSVRLYLYQHGYGITRILLVGNSETTYHLSKYLADNVQSGLEVVGIIANKSHIFEKLEGKQFKSLKTAIEKTNPHAIVQTDGEEVDSIYNQAIEHHLDYQFIPSHSALFTSRHSVELLGAYPIINVHTTPLIGYGRFIKRLVDIVFGSLLLLVFSPFMVFVWILLTFFDHGDATYKQKRLSRFNKTIYIYKFRTYYHAYHRMTPEEGFTKMGKPELIDKYRKNGDFLEKDPRVSKIGSLLRKTSLDELPQLINIVKGDISLVGPRSLEPFELESYEYKSLILSVKSGLTGLAQISGRRDISFEERRKLDMYYVQNWSVWMDIQIIIRTVFSVLTGRGAK